MICHMSLLFKRRHYVKSNDFERHVILCRKALNLLFAVGWKISDEFTPDMWDVLLKIMLAIADELFAVS